MLCQPSRDFRLLSGSWLGFVSMLARQVLLAALLGTLPATGQDADDDADDELPLPVAAEQAAAAEVRKLGGWYELDADQHVVSVNMVYHEGRRGRRENNGQMTDEVLPHLVEFPRLRQVLITQTQASDDGLEFVGRIPHLESLYIWTGREVTDAGVAHLRGLKELRMLHLSGAAITDEALQHLSEIPTLESLAMQNNPFTDLALEYAARMPNLRSLIIDNGAQFTDEGLQAIQKMPRLETLWLHNTGVSDEGLQALHGHKTLRTLWLSNFDDEAVEALQRATPDLVVQTNGKLSPSVHEQEDAADTSRHPEIRAQAAGGVKLVARYLDLITARKDEEARKIADSYSLSQLKKLREEPGFDGLDVSLAWGSREHVFVITSPALIREQGVQRVPQFVILLAEKRAGEWRIASLRWQSAGGNDQLEQFRAEHPAALKLD